SGGDIEDQSDSSDRVGARIGPRLYLALLATLSLAACFLPLADHLGYELSELMALAAGLFGGAPGIAAARMERDSSTRALSPALSRARSGRSCADLRCSSSTTSAGCTRARSTTRRSALRAPSGSFAATRSSTRERAPASR